MGVPGSPWLNANGVYTVTLSIVVEYFVVCGLTSFYLGSGVLVLLSALLLLQALLGSELLDRRHPITMWLLILWLVTAIGATMVGGRNYHASFAPYMTAKAGRRYAHVPVAGPAGAYADAGVIAFANGTAVDAARSVGLRVYGITYCAAPIVAQDNSTVDVQFWAVGMDCCASRGRFECDGVADAAAKGGAVVHGPQGGEEAAEQVDIGPEDLPRGVPSSDHGVVLSVPAAVRGAAGAPALGRERRRRAHPVARASAAGVAHLQRGLRCSGGAGMARHVWEEGWPRLSRLSLAHLGGVLGVSSRHACTARARACTLG
eukprot:CAMPEP_0171255332 /NCGR_PEP_ID=MMETSP0790-20130122/52715_1 /TAXON_ID=2925 /ORGANISM="Alexandrium catenella, Strain OF101" /LENGTH=316 /DNA_ID=CAMNT_0011723287 /DNA_START=41 /DNA_END=986 /DNA_ORIENTATION=-